MPTAQGASYARPCGLSLRSGGAFLVVVRVALDGLCQVLLLATCSLNAAIYTQPTMQ